MTESEFLPKEVRRLRDERSVVDALYRFGAGQDLKDEALFLSAFAADAILDFSHPAQRFGVSMPAMQGIDVIAGIPATLADLSTTHTVTNPRPVIYGDKATLWALVEAQHVRSAPPYEHLLLKNTYDVELTGDAELDDVWRITVMTIRNVWFEGEPEVLFGAPPSRMDRSFGADDLLA